MVVPPLSDFTISDSAILRTVLVSLLVLFAACPVTGSTDPAASDPAASAPAALLRSADETFQTYAENRDRIRFETMLTRDVVYLGEGLHRGYGAVLRAWDPVWNEKYGFSYGGEVLDVTVAESGDLGFTVGRVETRFRSPVDTEDQVQSGHYLTVWTMTPGGWKVAGSGPLDVHSTLGTSRDPRGALMAAWPDLTGRFGSEIDIRWTPESTVRSESGELAWVFGEYEAKLADGEAGADSAGGGSGYFLAIWQKDGEGHWHVAAESMTAPAESP